MKTIKVSGFKKEHTEIEIDSYFFLDYVKEFVRNTLRPSGIPYHAYINHKGYWVQDDERGRYATEIRPATNEEIYQKDLTSDFLDLINTRLREIRKEEG